MSKTSPDDRWLLPRRQTEYPARDVLPEATVHGRREATFLALAALFLVTTATLIMLGTSRVIDANALVASVLRATGSDAASAIVLPVAVIVPLGALPFAASFLAGAITCELFGRRRASALVWTGLVASVALAGLMYAADVLDGGRAFGTAVALAVCYLVAQLTNVNAFDALRRRARGRGLFVRIVVTTLVAEVIGWSAFAIALQTGAGTLVEPLGQDAILSLAVGGAAGSALCALVLAIPATFVARGLAVALRLDRDPLADSDDDSDGVPRGPRWVPASFAEGSVKLATDPVVVRATTGGRRAETQGKHAETGRMRAQTGGERAETNAKRAPTGGMRAQTGGERAETRAPTGSMRAQTGGMRAQTGSERAQTGGMRAPTGGMRAQTGSERPQTGGMRAQTGSERTQTGGMRAQTGSERTQTGGMRAQTGGMRAQTGGERAGTAGKRAPTGGKLAEGSVNRKLPPAVIVDDEEIQAFTSAEMRFFTEGDLATE